MSDVRIDGCEMSPADEVRFWAKVNKDGPLKPHMKTPCWPWTGFVGRYGVFTVKTKNMGAHRASWVFANGSDPGELYVCHHCDTKACVRPDHLFIGTNSDNMRDAVVKGTQIGASGDRHGMRLHPERVPRGERSGAAKLNEKAVAEIRRAYAAGGIIQRELAARYGVSRTTISQALSGKQWAHVLVMP